LQIGHRTAKNPPLNGCDGQIIARLARRDLPGYDTDHREQPDHGVELVFAVRAAGEALFHASADPRLPDDAERPGPADDAGRPGEPVRMPPLAPARARRARRP